LAVALRQSHGSNRGSAFEAGKAGLHRSTLSDTTQTEKASRFAPWGKFTTQSGWFSNGHRILTDTKLLTLTL
jgi:hypothetical protein